MSEIKHHKIKGKTQIERDGFQTIVPVVGVVVQYVPFGDIATHPVLELVK